MLLIERKKGENHGRRCQTKKVEERIRRIKRKVLVLNFRTIVSVRMLSSNERENERKMRNKSHLVKSYLSVRAKMVCAYTHSFNPSKIMCICTVNTYTIFLPCE